MEKRRIVACDAIDVPQIMLIKSFLFLTGIDTKKEARQQAKKKDAWFLT